jgi:5-methylcytosine-specific restriction protein A
MAWGPAKVAAKRERKSSNERGYTSAWRRAAKSYLTRYPLCVPCLRRGLITASKCVDHIRPHKGDPVLFWDQRNWEASCIRCNSAKAVREEGRWGERAPGNRSETAEGHGRLNSLRSMISRDPIGDINARDQVVKNLEKQQRD